MLIIFGGLPATGKTTLAKQLCAMLKAVYLRVDTIEHSLQQTTQISAMDDIGYRLAQAIATENLQLGQWVIADAVNPLQISRHAWRQVAETTQVAFLEIEVICSDKALHQQRALSRVADIDNFVLPTWADIEQRHYEPWTTDHLIIDTAVLDTAQAISVIVNSLSLV